MDYPIALLYYIMKQVNCKKTKQTIFQTKSTKYQPQNIQSIQSTSFIQKLSYALIRPIKIRYDPLKLNLIPRGSHDHKIVKIGFDLSIYLPINKQVKNIILYLHGNTSNRLEGNFMVNQIDPSFGLACFDFQGCGNRDGEFITLGLKQSKQVDMAAKYLKNQGYNVIGWGRSMGAVSLLLSSEINIMILDSPFSNLKSLCLQLVNNKLNSFLKSIIVCLYPCLYNIIKKDILNKTSYDIDQLDLVKHIQKMNTNKSIFFMSGDNDDIISCQHSRLLYEKFKGKKQLLIFYGTHNSIRQKYVNTRCFKFIKDSLEQKFSVYHIQSIRQSVRTQTLIINQKQQNQD